MSRFSLRSVEHAPVATGKWAVALFWELAPKVLFFFIAFALLMLLFKLFAPNSFEFSVFARAAVFALILGKVIALVDWAESGITFSPRRPIVVIVGKTVVYAMAVTVFGLGERIFEAFRKQHSLSAALDIMIANANMRRFLGLVLLISLVLGIYLTFQEIDEVMGEGSLLRMLFARPTEKKELSTG